MGVVLAGVIAFTAIVLLLVAIILSAKALLVPSGAVTISINGDASKAVSVPSGGKLLQTLANVNIFVPSACGGGGTYFSGFPTPLPPDKVLFLVYL